MIFLGSEIDYLSCLYATLVYDFSTSRIVVSLFVRFMSFENCVYRKIVAKSPFLGEYISSYLILIHRKNSYQHTVIALCMRA